ncbi:sensor domain-containing diguanylate cyclase [Desulfobacterium sp. N47]|uniref:Diguanylate cyclase n=1 Tax=uncultured Desulfobacterium sp. TaxID=201089 RepID=E1YG55_9BACT|nr:hypothetical protein N47_J05300 [uncultured Desulfobacterium sp.]
MGENKEIKEWYFLLFNNFSDSVFVNEWSDRTNFTGNFIDANDAACNQLGYTREELLQMSPSGIEIKFENPADISEILKMLLNNERAKWEGWFTRKDGIEIPVEVQNKLFFKNAKHYILSTVRDISDRKRAEKNLRKSEDKYRDLFQNANDASLLTDADDNLLEVNYKALELHGYSREELIGMSMYDLIPKENIHYFKEMIKEFKMNGGNEKFHVNTIAKDGKKLIVEVSASAIMEKNKYVGARTIVRDITDRIYSDIALRESEERYRYLVENSPNIIYSYSDKRGIIYNSSRVEDILGYSSHCFLEKPSFWFEYMHKDDHDKILKAVKDFSEGKHFNIEYRIKDKQGKWHWFEDRSISIINNTDEIIINGLATDITKRKLMEQEIREMSIRDQLTELYNRRGFITLAEQQLKSAKRANTRMTLLFLDSDGLKLINDTLGHEEGDKALFDTAEILRQTFRESDIIARIGGDEFAVLVVDSTNMNSTIITQRLQQNIDDFNSKKLKQYILSLSWGATIYEPDSGLTLDKLMSVADELMYIQKRAKQYFITHNYS